MVVTCSLRSSRRRSPRYPAHRTSGATRRPPRCPLAIVDEDDLVPSLADGLARLPSPPPSGVVCITGPSRSGDIEQILTLGVHGPMEVHVVLPAAAAT